MYIVPQVGPLPIHKKSPGRERMGRTDRSNKMKGKLLARNFWRIIDTKPCHAGIEENGVSAVAARRVSEFAYSPFRLK
jgi:hypothetical protein